MPEDRSLDEFAASDAPAADEGVESEGAESERAESECEAVGTDGDRSPVSDEIPTGTHVEPATSTAAWRSAGAACDRCGDRVTRRWIDDGDVVCANCKEW
ncbi:hypothetical protein U4E84_10555 [Halorubrum sp. AD140]|uniref:DUF7573 domain-containing protein n=1 Tax=Halorubrum sp. AD140 TaxID=3050073 RepID=UPI002ACC3C53|nr:hypothetical protein [Halorubrum sp. AD140]MDZ5811780.1 hypothetical protein [Halorubrum sp. AD140]